MPTAIDLEGQGQDAARLPQATVVRVQDKGGLCHHLLAAAHHSQPRQSGPLALRHEPQPFQSLGDTRCNDAKGQRCWKVLEDGGIGLVAQAYSVRFSLVSMLRGYT